MGNLVLVVAAVKLFLVVLEAVVLAAVDQVVLVLTDLAATQLLEPDQVVVPEQVVLEMEELVALVLRDVWSLDSHLFKIV